MALDSHSGSEREAEMCWMSMVDVRIKRVSESETDKGSEKGRAICGN